MKHFLVGVVLVAVAISAASTSEESVPETTLSETIPAEDFDASFVAPAPVASGAASGIVSSVASEEPTELAQAGWGRRRRRRYIRRRRWMHSPRERGQKLAVRKRVEQIHKVRIQGER